jgi:hypothetical protein
LAIVHWHFAKPRRISPTHRFMSKMVVHRRQ